MRFTSLRSKIFLLVGMTLLISAALVMILTQRNVTRTVSAVQEHAVHNVLNLLVLDSEARWGSYLHEKIATVRSNRQRLLEQGRNVLSVLTAYGAQADNGELTDARARELALQWITGLGAEPGGNVWVFDANYAVLASGASLERETVLPALNDYKGRPLAQSLYQEVRVSGQAFTLYHLADSAGGERRLRYAYAGYVPAWDWVVVVSDNAQGVVEQFERQRADTERAIADVLDDLRLAESGFAFIIGDDGRLISPPPPAQVELLGMVDTHTGMTLQGLLHSQGRSPDIQEQTFHPPGNEAWRVHTSYFRPLGWTIVGAVPESDYTRAATDLRNQLALFFLIVLAVGLLVAGILSLRLTRPLHELSEFARALPDQDLVAGRMLPAHIAELPHRRPDEVGRLAAAFAYMDEQLREKVARLLEETSSRERLESELNIAREIQQGLLPPPNPQLNAPVCLSATMVPAKEVGGDLYSYFLLPDGRLLFAIGDVSDKGMPAALFMAGTCTLIRALAETESDPAVMMTRINNMLSVNNPNLMFVTLIVGVLDLGNGRLQWANAGHSPLCALAPDGDIRLLEGRSGPACGVQEGLDYRLHKTQLDVNEMLIGYTDGVTEAVGPTNAQFGENRLYAGLATLAGADVPETLTAVLHQVRVFVENTPQSDDITLIAIQRTS